MVAAATIKGIHAGNDFQGIHKLLYFSRSLVFPDIPDKGKFILIFFHCDKCKKYSYLFKNNSLKKLLCLIITKSLVNQGVFYHLVYFCFSCTFQQYKLYSAKFIFFIMNQQFFNRFNVLWGKGDFFKN